MTFLFKEIILSVGRYKGLSPSLPLFLGSFYTNPHETSWTKNLKWQLKTLFEDLFYKLSNKFLIRKVRYT